MHKVYTVYIHLRRTYNHILAFIFYYNILKLFVSVKIRIRLGIFSQVETGSARLAGVADFGNLPFVCMWNPSDRT